MPIWAKRSGSAVPKARVSRPGAMSSRALRVIAVNTGCLVFGFSAPSPIRISGTRDATTAE